MKQKLILLGILIAWLFAALVVLSGCNVNKHITKTSTDSTTVKKVDSASVNTSDLSKTEGSSTTDNSSIDVELVGGDSSTWTPHWAHEGGNDSLYPYIKNPKNNGDAVYFKSDNHGGYAVTSNVPIKSIKIKDSKITEQHKTSDSAVSKVNTIHTSDSTHLVKQVSVKDIVKKSGWSLLDWIVVIGIGLVCIFIAAAIYLKGNPLAYLFGFVRKKRDSNV